MSARLLDAMGRLPIWARRGLMIVFPLLLLGVLVAGFALAPTATTPHPDRAAASERVLPPSASSSTARPRSPTPPAQTTLTTHTREGSSAAQRPPARGRVGNPELPPSPRSSRGAMLEVARRFSVAYMPYQIGRLTGGVRAAIKRTCTPAFARYLLGQPPRLTAELLAHPKAIETYRVASVEPRRRREQSHGELRLTAGQRRHRRFPADASQRRGRWLIAATGDVSRGAAVVAVRARADDPRCRCWR